MADGAQVTYKGQKLTLAHPLVVLVDNVEQQEGVDYDAYREIGRVIFRYAVPPTALVKIEYYYDLRQTTPSASAEVAGLDLDYRISQDMGLRADLARSTGGASGMPGQAMKVTLNYNQPKFGGSAEYRDMEPTFSFLDTTGFRRQEKGLTLNLLWEPSRHIQVSNRRSSMNSSQGLSFGYSGYGGGYGFNTGGGGYYGLGYNDMDPAQSSTTTGLDVSTDRNDLDLHLTFPGWPRLDISRQNMSNAGGSRGASDYKSTSLRLDHSFGKRLRLNANLADTKQRYAGSSSNGDDAESSGSQTKQRQMSVDYRPSDKVSLSAHLGRNRSAALVTTANASHSNTLRLSARWQPSNRFSINLDRSGSESTGRVSSGFYGGFPGSGYGSGYAGGGGGWPGPIAGGTYPYQADDEEEDEETQTRYEDATTSLGIDYRLSDALSLNFNTRRRKYTSGGGAGYLADSNQRSRSLSVTWRASDTFTVTSSLSKDNLNFLQEGRGAVNNRMLNVSLNYQPPDQPWGANVSLNRMSGSSPTYINIGSHQHLRIVSTSLFDLSGQLNYRLREHADLYVRAGLSDFDSGYSAFKKNTAEMGLQCQLSDTSRLSFGYRFIKHLAGNIDSPFYGYVGTAMQSQDYIANTFSLTFQTSFAGGVAGGGRFAGPTASFGGTSYGGYGTGGMNLGTFGGYQAGFGQPYRYGSSGQRGGYGPFAPGGGYGRGRGGLTPFPSRERGGAWDEVPRAPQGQYQQQRGFETGLGKFEQEQTRRQTQAPPSLDWEAAPPPAQQPPASGPRPQPWPLLEGLSRWTLPDTDRLW